jgi:SAM-dependent methyltransferase
MAAPCLSHFSGEILEPTGDRCHDNPDIAVGRCPKTGLVQLLDFGHVSDDPYRAESYFPGDGAPERERQREWSRRRMRTLRHHLGDISRFRILDFGAGTGAFLEAAQEEAGNIVGYDMNPKACQVLSSLGWECFNSLDDVPRGVDMITLFHVLEHVPEPWTFMADLRGRFPDVRLFVVEVPHTDEALNSLFRNDSFRARHFNSLHLYYFTNRTMAMVLERAGLKVKVNTQLQRYSLANHLGWLSQDSGGGQDQWKCFNEQPLNDEYEKVLVGEGLADSVFILCEP